MAVLAWLLIPLFAVVGAAIWGSWASRNKTIGDVAELAGYARFRDAMERSHTVTAGTSTGSAPAAAASASALPEREAAPATTTG
ncbi:hypothetical protein [Streptomyces roseicoloratus]|uniref:Secreted protein n=1 Tax=Streptomyces roseicoloratus TaxID=2508722 RepID=A0ABY9RSI3_9ACTN|nr:hypothetical protein [Streptomyces roseicoloratus]WMX45159.1 hypothetical protein RGF97_10245 [Streptomyces roseicoloratus]